MTDSGRAAVVVVVVVHSNELKSGFSHLRDAEDENHRSLYDRFVDD